MFNNMGNKLKVLAWVILFLGIIGSIILGINAINTAEKIKENNPKADTGLNGFVVMAIGIISSIISSWIVYTIGDNNDMLYENRTLLMQIASNVRRNNLNTNIKTNNTTSPITSVKICKYCGEENSSLAMYCKSCGEYL